LIGYFSVWLDECDICVPRHKNTAVVQGIHVMNWNLWWSD